MKKELIYEDYGYINSEVEISRISKLTLEGELDESIWIKKGNIELECFDCYPRHDGPKLVQGGIYQTAIFIRNIITSTEIAMIDKSTIYSDEKPEPKAVKIDESYKYDLYGVVKDGIFHLEDFQFLFIYTAEEYDRWYVQDGIYTEEPYIRWRVTQIAPEFLKRIG